MHWIKISFHFTSRGRSFRALSTHSFMFSNNAVVPSAPSKAIPSLPSLPSVTQQPHSALNGAEHGIFSWANRAWMSCTALKSTVFVTYPEMTKIHCRCVTSPQLRAQCHKAGTVVPTLTPCPCFYPFFTHSSIVLHAFSSVMASVCRVMLWTRPVTFSEKKPENINFNHICSTQTVDPITQIMEKRDSNIQTLVIYSYK